MQLSPFIKQLLERKFGYAITTSADCRKLILTIEEETGELLGLNTLKRLLGFVPDQRETRLSTLNIVARYLGYSSWDELEQIDREQGNSVFGNDDNELFVSSLKGDTLLQVTYPPDRKITLRPLGDDRCEVTHSEHSKLLEGDVVTISRLVRGFPMLVSDVVRKGESLGAFTAGRAHGIDFAVL